MDVGTRKKRLDHIVVAAYVGNQSQFNLRVVGTHEQVAPVGYEGASYFAAVVGAYGDVLQVGVCR